MRVGRHMKILHISVRADTGGGPQHIWSLLRGFSDHEITAFVACPRDYPYWERYEKCEVVEELLPIPHRKFSLKSLFKLRKFIGDKGIDLIHSHGKGAGLYSRLLSLLTRVPVVHTLHGVHVGEYGFVKLTLYKIYERIMSAFSARVILVSEAEKKAALRYNLLSESTAEVVYNGIDISLAKSVSPVPATELKTDSGAESGSGPPPIIIVNVNRFNYQKNPWMVLDIYKELLLKVHVPFLFLILGDGDWREEFNSRVETLGASKHFILPGSVDEPLSYFKSSHIFLSTARWEGLPLAPLEAMSCSLPLVLSDVTGNDEIVEGGSNGFLFDVHKPFQAVEFLSLLINDSLLREKMAANGLNLVAERFNHLEMVGKTVTIYESVIR